jgi:hypothetical protein
MSLQIILNMPTLPPTTSPAPTKHDDDTIATRVWFDEYVFLQSVHDCADNCSPRFRMPDLISACVSIVFADPYPSARIFSYLHTKLVLRDPDTIRRQEIMWKVQYQLLLALQRSPANNHPHPQFKLDHFTTACIALVQSEEHAQFRILDEARLNTALRSSLKKGDANTEQ